MNLKIFFAPSLSKIVTTALLFFLLPFGSCLFFVMMYFSLSTGALSSFFSYPVSVLFALVDPLTLLPRAMQLGGPLCSFGIAGPGSLDPVYYTYLHKLFLAFYYYLLVCLIVRFVPAKKLQPPTPSSAERDTVPIFAPTQQKCFWAIIALPTLYLQLFKYSSYFFGPVAEIFRNFLSAGSFVVSYIALWIEASIEIYTQQRAPHPALSWSLFIASVLADLLYYYCIVCLVLFFKKRLKKSTN